ncbi:MAG: hypothetical protein P4L46_11150 [Fimbriimonas sp.]|nr:hypothetical protein [Fimbriimonas sp.]
MRRFTSLVLLGLLITNAWAQAFGRFGYNQSVQISGLKVDKEGFVASDPVADKIRFASTSHLWRPVSTSDVEQVVALETKKGGPSKAGFSLLSLGFSLYFPEGIDLKVGTIGSPYLSWEQGSVGDSIPTPDVKWLVLSFKDKQPAYVFGFLDAPASLTIVGTPGAWEVKSDKAFKGWVRVGLPTGLESQLANTPGSLGRLAKSVSLHASQWINHSPKLVKTTIESDLRSVTATWKFDRPGAVVPEPAILAELGHYLIKVQSKTFKMPGWTDEGPIEVLDGNDLTVRFPIRRVPTGRALGVGTLQNDGTGTVSPIDIAGVCSLALASLEAGRDQQTHRTAEDTSAEYISEASFFTEPWTEQQLPFDAYGHGIDVAAAHALLSQAITSATRATSESNSMLTSVTWRMDWQTWRIWTTDSGLSQRAGSLAALAGSLCPEPERRLAAAMLQAGLSGLRGLGVWRRRQGLIEEEPKLLEPLFGVRKGIFGLFGPTEEGEPFAVSLLSPLRVFTEAPVALVKRGNDYFLQWSVVDAKPSVITLASAYPIDAVAHLNLTKLRLEGALGFTEIHFTPETAGICEAKLILPDFAARPVEMAALPSYSEILR